MSVFKQYQSVFANWDKEIFKNIHHDDFLFIRETELLTLDEHVKVIDNAVKTTDFAEQQNRNMVLIHANEYVEEYRWRDNDDIVTVVFLLKNGKTWRQIANRVPAAESLSVL
ncbi:MAG: hypothetical protein CML56_09300 [Rhodobacteraceae bacterium]|nr:hypothetical protein [Paracoccaceae bacterium]